MKPQDPRALPDHTARDALIASIAGLLVLGFIVYGIMTMGRVPSSMVTGTVVEKVFTSAPEQQITFGSKGLKSKEIEGEYLLKVRVEKENRTFEVPVEKPIYESKRVGDPLTFLRPPSERR